MRDLFIFCEKAFFVVTPTVWFVLFKGSSSCHQLPCLFQVIGSLDKRGEAGNWSACSWCGLPCGCVDAPYAVLGHHSLIIPPLCIRHGTFLKPSSGLHAVGLPLPRVVIGGVAHVVIYKRVLGLLVFVVAVAHLYMRGDGTGPNQKKKREQTVKLQHWRDC